MPSPIKSETSFDLFLVLFEEGRVVFCAAGNFNLFFLAFDIGAALLWRLRP